MLQAQQSGFDDFFHEVLYLWCKLLSPNSFLNAYILLALATLTPLQSLQLFCIFLFICAASLFGTVIAQVNEIVIHLTTRKKDLDNILASYVYLQPRSLKSKQSTQAICPLQSALFLLLVSFMSIMIVLWDSLAFISVIWIGIDYNDDWSINQAWYPDHVQNQRVGAISVFHWLSASAGEA